MDYTYGASNHRLKQFEYGSGGGTCYYAWDGNSIIAEFSDNGSALSWTKSYVYLGNRLLATPTPGGTTYHHPDRLGTRLVTGETGGLVAAEQTTLPYGTALDIESMNTPTNRRFTSYDRSQKTKLDYAVNRFYNACQGRFTQVDPIGMSAASLSDPQSMNLYAYVGNDPINRIDPTGLFWGWLAKAFKFVFKVAAALLVAVILVVQPELGATLILLGIAGLAGLAGWHNGKLGEIAGKLLTFGGYRPNFRTPGINGVSGVSNFLASQAKPSIKGQLSTQFASAFVSLLQQGQEQKPGTQSEKSNFSSCYENNQFSSLFADTRFHSAVKFFEIGADISFFGDILATAKKAAGTTIGKPQAYASGINWVFRRVSTGTTRGALTTFGGLATRALAVTAVFTLAYNGTIAVQCQLRVLK